MKSKEFTQLSGHMLYEALDQGNTTGVSTADLVRVVEAHRDNVWSEPVSAESYLQSLREGKLAWQKTKK
jgi:hypothetical protein